MLLSELDRFERSYVPEPNSGCWLWLGRINDDGYGKFQAKSKRRFAHRVAFEHWNGPIPEGKEMDHICNVRSCVNPKHLRAITHKENIAKSGAWEFNRKKTHCPKGHEYSGENLYRLRGKRHCITCQRIKGRLWMRKYRERIRAGLS